MVRPWFSDLTWDEFDRVLTLWALRRKVSEKAAQDYRSGVLDGAQIFKVEAVFRGCRDPHDDMFIDVLEQTPARWLCSDDGDLHALAREDIVGLGELVRMIQEVS